jgi:hypothetical protein
MSIRKPHNDFVGYVCELRNAWSGGHTIILDCKRAQEEGQPLVADYAQEGGRYQVLCNEHGHLVYSPNLPVARECMKDATSFCMLCRAIAGEVPVEDAGLTDEEVATVQARKNRETP